MPAFPYNRAALVLAEAKCFGKKLICQKYQVPRTTYTNWNKKLKTDDKLAHLVRTQSKALTQEWEDDITKTLKQTLLTINKALDNHPFSHPPQTVKEIELWGKNVYALSKMIQSLGDLAIGSRIIFEEE